MDIHSCNLILPCFFGLTTSNLFPGFINSILYPELSTAPGCPKLSYYFIWGRERKGRDEEMNPSLVL